MKMSGLSNAALQPTPVIPQIAEIVGQVFTQDAPLIQPPPLTKIPSEDSIEESFAVDDEDEESNSYCESSQSEFGKEKNTDELKKSKTKGKVFAANFPASNLDGFDKDSILRAVLSRIDMQELEREILADLKQKEEVIPPVEELTRLMEKNKQLRQEFDTEMTKLRGEVSYQEMRIHKLYEE